ncbi:hypothetical protein NDU88_004191 [Pleurodeles waltl]|uniref:Uncharacterized protein n=1 Tax=Pleurodeles waltl TaxID=8319 RepID=A0AAV7RF27_PLEWA|nr:hypothetical protein NDU88_004191 [Pleurodeles waltl]
MTRRAKAPRDSGSEVPWVASAVSRDWDTVKRIEMTRRGVRGASQASPGLWELKSRGSRAQLGRSWH